MLIRIINLFIRKITLPYSYTCISIILANRIYNTWRVRIIRAHSNAKKLHCTLIHIIIKYYKSPHIINISSNQVDGCWPRATIYGPTKAAGSKFTKNTAMELSLKGVRMAAVAPGYTDVGWEPGDVRLEAASRLPLRRFASTTEIAKAVVYLASDDAAYITGSTLTIDGGATLPVVAANDFV